MFNNKRCSFTRKSVSSAPVLSAYTITLGWQENSHHRHGDLALKYRLESSSRNFCNLKKNRMSQTSGQVTTYLSHTHTHAHTHTRAHTHTACISSADRRINPQMRASASESGLGDYKQSQERKLKLSCMICGWGECNMGKNVNALYMFGCNKCTIFNIFWSHMITIWDKQNFIYVLIHGISWHLTLEFKQKSH